jgi:hypothetical protein
MDEDIDEEEQLEVGLRRPFQPKFMKELNHLQHDRNKKQKRKLREQQYINPQKKEKL